MQRIIITIFLFLAASFHAHASMRSDQLDQKTHIGAFSENTPISASGAVLYLVETELGYIAFLEENGTRSKGRFINRDPLGYVDGMSLYVGYFAQGFGLDPSGTSTYDYTKQGAKPQNGTPDWRPYIIFTTYVQIGKKIDESKWVVTANKDTTFNIPKGCKLFVEVNTRPTAGFPKGSFNKTIPTTPLKGKAKDPQPGFWSGSDYTSIMRPGINYAIGGNSKNAKVVPFLWSKIEDKEGMEKAFGGGTRFTFKMNAGPFTVDPVKDKKIYLRYYATGMRYNKKTKKWFGKTLWQDKHQFILDTKLNK